MAGRVGRSDRRALGLSGGLKLGQGDAERLLAAGAGDPLVRQLRRDVEDLAALAFDAQGHDTTLAGTTKMSPPPRPEVNELDAVMILEILGEFTGDADARDKPTVHGDLFTGRRTGGRLGPPSTCK